MNETIKNLMNTIETIENLYELLPAKCLAQCHCSGDNYEACAYWVRFLGLKVPKDTCVKLLSQYGDWEDGELENEHQYELNIKLLWIAAGYEG